jgi:hypothetical protein
MGMKQAIDLMLKLLMMMTTKVHALYFVLWNRGGGRRHTCRYKDCFNTDFDA